MSDVKIQLLSEIVSDIYSDDEHLTLLTEQSEATIRALVSIMYIMLDLKHTVYVYISPDYKVDIGHLKIHPKVKPIISLTWIPQKIHTNGSTTDVDIPALKINEYVISHKYIDDVQIKIEDSNYTLFDFINPRTGFDLYKRWFITDPDDLSFNNLIHVDFKNHPSKKGK